MNHPRAPFVKKEVEVHFVYESVKNHNDAVGDPVPRFAVADVFCYQRYGPRYQGVDQ